MQSKAVFLTRAEMRGRSCIFFLAMPVGVFAYLKLVKNKPKTKGNDSLDDYDYGEEDSEEWETEDEESDEPDADGGSTEEDDEDSVK